MNAGQSKLYDTTGQPGQGGEAVKSLSHDCSKRYSMTHTDLHHIARQLLEDTITEDIELLKAMSTLCNLISWKETQEWKEKIIKGEAGRNEIRAALKAIKEKVKADKEKAETNEKISHAKPKEPPPPPPWTLDDAMDDLSQALTYAHNELSAADLLNTWTDEQRAEIESRLNSATEKGKNEGFPTISHTVIHGLYYTPFMDIDLLAMIEGYSGKPFNWLEFTARLQTPGKSLKLDQL